jgi:hypothetical protein
MSMKESADPFRRVAMFCAAVALFAAAMTLGSIHVVSIGAPFDPGSPVDMVTGWLAFVALSPLTWFAGNAKVVERGWKERLPLAIAVSIAVAVLSEAAGSVATGALSALRGKDHLLRTMDDGMRIKFICAFAIIQIVQGLRFRIERLEQEHRAEMLEAQLSATRLSALRMQLRPHFLFNTLNSVTALLRRDRESARRMLFQLSALFERSFELDGCERVPLREEISLLANYIEIEQTRFGARLTVDIEIADDVADALVPSLLLQPLVENAIRHGLSSRATGGSVRVRGFRKDDTLLILISDDGRGLPPERYREGIGLKNTRLRLEYLYGKRQELDLDRGHSGGVTVQLRLPLEMLQAAESAA